MTTRRTVGRTPLAAVVAVALVGVLALGALVSVARPAAASAGTAPEFQLPDIYGHPFDLTEELNHSVVVVEFTSLSCSECQVVEHSLYTLYDGYNASGTSPVRIISIFINPSFGDTIPALRAYHAKNNITWTMAQDTTADTVYNLYGVGSIPDVVVVDQRGDAVYDVSGAQSLDQLRSSVGSALSGKATPVSLVTVSVFALAAVAGLTTFFSPCAFPMFPGYMSLFLGLNATSSSTAAGTATYRGAVRRALSAGSVSAVGMMVVFLAIGVALIAAASVVGGYIPYFMVVVGAILIGLGALLLTNLQYWKIVSPFQALWARMRGHPATAAAASSVDLTAGSGRGFYLKLFSYGMGYAAAAAGCVAPVILAAIVAGMALGLVDGIASILIYSLTAALLMIGVTLLLAVAGKRYVNQLKALTPVIKKVSAVVLVVIGVYLIYFFYTAWVV